MHLSPASDSRLHEVPELVVRDFFHVLILKVLPDRTGTHDAHLAPEHIEELGQLVHPGAAENAANSGDPGISLFGPPGAVLFGVCNHGAELKAGVLPAVAAHALLDVEDRTGRVEFDGDGDKKE